MSLVDLQPGYSNRAGATDVKAFVQFSRSENIDLDYVKGCIQRDDSGKCVVSVMDKIGMYLAFNESSSASCLLDILACSTTDKLSIGC